ncbi:hypothetical protein IKX73_01545 [Candidatus Saccharibacteria bacterium]|nr:hypothetical protein [Candidatus Saccharibacteria bacterium]
MYSFEKENGLSEKYIKRLPVKEVLFALIPLAVSVLIMMGIEYLALPALTLRSPGFAWFVVAGIAILAISYAVFFQLMDWDGFWLVPWIVLGAVILIALVMGMTSWTCFHAPKAVAVADVTVSETAVTEAFPDLAEAGSVESLALVDLDSAVMLGDKKVAGLKNASWYDINKDYNLIQYQGKIYRLSFLEYGGLRKWWKAKYDGIPGYVLVECTPEGGVVSQSATLVELEEPIRYSEGAYFGHDLRRHLRRQYPQYMFDESRPEIDDNGTPYYVTGVLRPTCGVWGVRTVSSVILTNAQTGESAEYAVDQVPEWVDNIYSLDYLMDIAGWHYAYRRGWWNAVFGGKTDVWYTSYHYRDSRSNSDDGKFANFYGYSATVVNGRVTLYTGLTAANSAESNLGWLLLDARSGKMTQYAVVGAEESSAQAAAEQLVSAYRYQATFPLPVNVGGEPTYLMCLKGAAGIVQGYALCNVDNYAIVVQAETLPEAIGQYLAKLGHTQVAPPIQSAPTDEYVGAEVFFDGEVVNTYTIEVNGTTQIYFEMDDGSVYVVVKIK